MERSILLFAAVSAAALTACATSGPSRIADEQRAMSSMRIDIGGVSGAFDLRYMEDLRPAEDTIGAPLDAVWNALPGAYVQLDIPLASVNPDARLLGNDGFRAQGRLGEERISSYIHCGRTMTGSIADEADVFFVVLTQLQEVDAGRTRVVTLVDATARPSATSGNSVRCSSRGRLERALHRRVRLGMAAPGAGGA